MQSSHEEHIQASLNEIWADFRKANITDSYEIIEYIATLLLQIEAISPLSPELTPRISGGKGNLDEEYVKTRLLSATSQAEGSGNFFDRYVLFQSFDTGKDTYPIPRHIVRFMLDILTINPQDSFADLTCGSGGFLIHRYDTETPHIGPAVGTELSPAWGRIAAANIALHALPNVQLYLGDAFRVTNGTGELAATSFDRIAMAPPFGITIDQKTAQETLHITSGRSSEILFTRLALQKLTSQGLAAIMVPDTLLSPKRAGEKLKQDLLVEHTLRAVISLGEGALYPFNALSFSVLLLEKQHRPEIQPWILNVVNDGYPRRRNRDITQLPGSDNDLPIVASVLQLRRTDMLPVPVAENPAKNSLFFVTPLVAKELSATIGFVIGVAAQSILASIWLVEEQVQEHTRRYFLARAYQPGQSVQYIAIPLDAANFQLANIQQGENDTAWLEGLSSQRHGTAIFASRASGQMVALSLDGHLLGCTRPITEITQDAYNLRPLDYLNSVGYRQTLTSTHLHLPEGPRPKGPTGHQLPETQTLEDEPQVPGNAQITPSVPPAKTLHEIKQQEYLIWRYANYLQDVLETRIFKELPPHRQDFTSFNLLRCLGQEQRAIWDAIQTFVDAGEHPLYFTQKRILQIVQTDVVKLQHTLDLLLQAGVILRVLIQRPDKSIITCYRLATGNDVIPKEESIYAPDQDQN